MNFGWSGSGARESIHEVITRCHRNPQSEPELASLLDLDDHNNIPIRTHVLDGHKLKLPNTLTTSAMPPPNTSSAIKLIVISLWRFPIALSYLLNAYLYSDSESDSNHRFPCLSLLRL